jgi:hypothetical protein
MDLKMGICSSRNARFRGEGPGFCCVKTRAWLKTKIRTRVSWSVLYWKSVGTASYIIGLQFDDRPQVRTCKLSGRPASIPVPAVPMKTIQSVHFPLEVVTAISRGPNSAELYQLDAFERHVRRCDDCVTASHSRMFSEALCPRGRHLAGNMLAWVIGAPNGHTYSTACYRTRYIRVEIPRRMTYTRRLYSNNGCKRNLRFGEIPRKSAYGMKPLAEAVRRRFTVVYRTRVAK